LSQWFILSLNFTKGFFYGNKWVMVLVGSRFRVLCHREGVARGDPLWSSKRRDKLFAFPETRWIAA